jgi:adenylate cyclase
MSSDTNERYLPSAPPPRSPLDSLLPETAPSVPPMRASDPPASEAEAIAPPAPRAPVIVEPAAPSRPPEDRAHPRDAFEKALAREILDAERFRATLLAAIPTLTLFALVVMRGAYPELLVSLLHGNFDLAPVGLFLIGVAGFELYILATLRRLLRGRARSWAPRRYAQAFVETSLPTAAVVYYALVDGPVQALLMPSAFVYFVFILLSTLRLDFALSTFTGLVAALEYAVIALVWGGNDTSVMEPSLRSLPHHVGKALILLVSGVAAGFVAQRLRRSFTRAIEAFDERQRILGVFGQHVSPEVVERLVEDKAEVKSELRDVCVMFLDIRNFTAFAESKSPAEVVEYLNLVFESTIDAVVSRHGIVNKFLGDGFMAIFGGPILGDAGSPADASRAAVDAALDIVARIEKLVADGVIAPTQIGIGLHAGRAVVGNIGSAQRKEYTVIGDVVNVASRIEALNKELGSSVLASDEVWSASGRTDVDAKPREAIAIRGRSQPVRIWQLA